jgi:hypothetical protein
MGKIYQNDQKVPIPNGLKIYHHLLLQETPKFNNIWMFGLKIVLNLKYLAALLTTTTKATTSPHP